ncbi:MAG: carbohydrate-binding protein [Chitinophagaceae bacterium]
MKNQNLVASIYLMATLSLMLNFSGVKAQTQTPRYQSIITNSKAFYEYLPQGYSSETQTYPLLVFLHGVGELGDGSVSSLPTVLRNGPPKLINEGNFPVSFTVNGQVFKFIVISPQFISWPSATDVQGVIDYAVRTYRVNTNRIYLTGLSMGGGGVWDYATYSIAYANRLAALLPVCGSSGPSTAKAQVIASTNLPVWATHNQNDPTVPSSYTINYVDYINSSSPKPSVLAKRTIFPVSGHDAWTTTYATSFRENNLNVYEWMLQYQRGTSQPSNQLPVSNAGSDITITLPTNSMNLAGGGTDYDGNITGYNWTKISGPAQFSINNSGISNATISNLAAGDYTLRLTVTDNSGGTAYDDVTVKVLASTTAMPIPGRIEAENYSAMNGIQTDNTSDAGAGKLVGWIDTGDWMDYNVSVASAGNYTVSFRLASQYESQQLQLRNSSGTALATVVVPQTGSVQNWTTVTATAALQAGNQTLRIYSSNGSWNINWIDFAAASGAPGAPVGAVIPGKIEAENYSAMNGVLTDNTTDAGGGKLVGWTDTGDWMDYTATVSSPGNYTVNFRLASSYASQQLQLKNSSGTVLATITVPQTGGPQNWTTATATVALPAGNQTLRIYSSNGSWNINWVEFISGSQSPTRTVIPGRVEAENYNTMNGTLTTTSTDAGGGSIVGWVDSGDWLDYNVSVATAGNYTVNYRVATPYGGQQIQLRNSGGTVLQTINVPQTGNFQSWTTVSATVSLPAGDQTLRIYSSNGSWNINWFEFLSTATGTNAAGLSPVGSSLAVSEQAVSSIEKGSFSLYPNPVRDNFSLQLNNSHLGTVNIQVGDQSGKIMKTFRFEKTQSVAQLNLLVKGLSPGTYYIKVQIGSWSDSRKLIKL